MKHSSLKLFTLGTALLIATLTGLAENSRYETVVNNGSNQNVTITVREGEVAEVMSATTRDSTYLRSPSVLFIKNNLTILAQQPGGMFIGYSGSPFHNPRGSMIAGPATVVLQDGTLNYPAMLTVKITPSSYDVNKTLILPPGTNQIYVGMESSTNLVNWSDATNGVYGSPEVARFFRMRQSTLPSQ